MPSLVLSIDALKLFLHSLIANANVNVQIFVYLFFWINSSNSESLQSIYNTFLQTISYMAERVVGTGSFGIVFQVLQSFFY